MRQRFERRTPNRCQQFVGLLAFCVENQRNFLTNLMVYGNSARPIRGVGARRRCGEKYIVVNWPDQPREKDGPLLPSGYSTPN